MTQHQALDASYDELWDACSEVQQDAIRESFTTFYAADVTMALSEGKPSSALATWEQHKQDKLDRMARDGEIHQ